VKKQHLVANVAGQFQEKTAKKTYLAVSVGVAPPGCGDSFIVDAPIGDHRIVQEARTVDFSGDGKDARTTCEIVARADTPLFDITDESVAVMTTPKGVSPMTASKQTPPTAIAALVRVTPLTGRTHQIRVHLAHAGLPIVSDALYGPHLRWGAQSDEEKSKVVWSAAQLAACNSENPTQMHQLTPPDSRDAREPYNEWGGSLSIRRQALHAFKLELTHPETGETLSFQAKMPSDMRGVCDALGLATSDY
jgi:23S rRNA-/tRNA-specific pseudouridylate synthase